VLLVRVRLSNEIDWAAEFAAHDRAQLEAGCRWAWRQHVKENGINKVFRLYLHYWDGKDFMSSGQYALGADVKIKLPPKPHVVSRVAGENNWDALWVCLERCNAHAEKFQGLVEFVIDPTKQDRSMGERKLMFKVIRGGLFDDGK
jgi:hypothetical protein